MPIEQNSVSACAGVLSLRIESKIDKQVYLFMHPHRANAQGKGAICGTILMQAMVRSRLYSSKGQKQHCGLPFIRFDQSSYAQLMSAPYQPRRAASIAAMSIFVISIMASNAAPSYQRQIVFLLVILILLN